MKKLFLLFALCTLPFALCSAQDKVRPVDYEVVEDAPNGYHQMKFVSAPSWAYGGENKPSMPDAPFYDHFDEDEGVVSFKVTQTLYDTCAEDGGGLRITGYGYKIVKVTYN